MDRMTQISLSLQLALLGMVTPPLRQVRFSWDGAKNVKLYFFYESQPSFEEIEEVDLALTEVLADFPWDWDIRSEIVISNEQKIPFPEENENFAKIVYMRKEIHPPSRPNSLN